MRITIKEIAIYGALLLCLLIAGLGIPKLIVSSDYRVYFEPENPQLRAFEAQETLFDKNDLIQFLLRPKSGRLFTQEHLPALLWLTQRAHELPWKLRVESPSNFPYVRIEEDELIVTDILSAEVLPDLKEIGVRERVALRDPFVVGRLIAHDGKAASVVVVLQFPGVAPHEEVPAAMDAARVIQQEFEQKFPEFEIFISGVVPLNHGVIEATWRDATLLVGLASVLMFLMLWGLLGSLAGAAASFAVVGASAGLVVGGVGLIGKPVSTATAGAPIIIMTLAIAHCVHLLINYFQARATGMNQADSMARSLQQNRLPIVLTSLTTIAGFLSLNLNDVPPFRDMGNYVAIGVAAGCIFALTLLPCWMLRFDRRPAGLATADRFCQPMFRSWGDLLNRYSGWLMAGLLMLMLPLFSGIQKNYGNDVFPEYFDPGTPVRQAVDFQVEHMGGMDAVYFTVEATGDNAQITDAAVLRQMHEFSHWLRVQERVHTVFSLSDLMRKLNWLFTENFEVHPDNAMNRQFLSIYELSLSDGHRLSNLIDNSRKRTRLAVLLKSSSSAEVREFSQRAMDWLNQNTPDLKVLPPSGPTMMFAYISEQNIRSMLVSTTVALLLVSILLWPSLRSFRLAVISLAPNLVPLALAFGIWGYWRQEINMATAVVTAMAVGIIVDDTVHFLSKFLRQHRAGMDTPQALNQAFIQVGPALVCTSLILVGGFLILAQSNFVPTQRLGELSALVISLALLFDLLFLPLLLRQLYRKKHVSIQSSAG